MTNNRPLLTRYELKYWITPQLLPSLRRRLEPFCRTDSFSTGQPRNRYPVGSLYLDNRDFDLYQATVDGNSQRFKLRIRSYSDEPDAPVFFEVKKRDNRTVHKNRSLTTRSIVKQFLAGESVPVPDPDFAEFVRCCAHTQSKPTLRVRYEREAYESRTGDRVRVTIDHNIMHAITVGADISINGPGWVETPTQGAVLELKFTGIAPTWVTNMVRDLEIQRTSVAKYVLSLDRAFLTHGRAPWLRPSVGRS